MTLRNLLSDFSTLFGLEGTTADIGVPREAHIEGISWENATDAPIGLPRSVGMSMSGALLGATPDLMGGDDTFVYNAVAYPNGHVTEVSRELSRFQHQARDALAAILSDDKSMFIAEQIYQLENKSIAIKELDGHLSAAEGWIPFSKLVAGRVVEINSRFVNLTVLGEQLVEALNDRVEGDNDIANGG